MEGEKNIIERLDKAENRLDKVEDKTDRLSEDGREYKVQIQNLCKSVDNLVNTIKWGLGILIPSLLVIIGFIIKK